MAAQASTSAGAHPGFLDLALDPRLQRALAKRGFAKPSTVQAACVPEALAGRDIVARARTGSGKTLAYLLPALHRVLSSEEVVGNFKAIVLVPTRELCEQVGVELVAMQCHSRLLQAKPCESWHAMALNSTMWHQPCGSTQGESPCACHCQQHAVLCTPLHPPHLPACMHHAGQARSTDHYGALWHRNSGQPW